MNVGCQRKKDQQGPMTNAVLGTIISANKADKKLGPWAGNSVVQGKKTTGRNSAKIRLDVDSLLCVIVVTI